MTQYTVNGQTYNVAPEKLDKFMTEFPDAKKVATVDDFTMHTYFNKEGDNWQRYNVRGDKLEKFKTEFPEARTKEGWEDYAKKQKEEADAFNKKQADEAAERELKQKNQKEENDLLVKEHDTLGDRSYQELTKIYKDAGGPKFFLKSNDERPSGRNRMVEWLKKNKYKDVDFSKPFDVSGSIDTSKLDIPQPLSVMGIETDQPTDSEETKLGDTFLEDINKYNSDIQNILSNPILNENGKVDYVKTQEAIDEIQANMPDGLEVRTDNVDDSLSWEQLNEAERRRYKQLLDEIESNPNLKDMEVQYDGFGRPIPQLVQGVDPNDKTLPYNFSDEEKRKHIYDIILEERKQKLEQYKKGEIDLTTEELSNMVTVDQGMKDYMQRFLPDPEQMVAMEDSNLTDDQNVLNAMNSAVMAAVSSDPRFQFVQKNIIKQVDNEAEAKLIEIRNKYKLEEGITQEKLEKVQEEFTDWYNNSVSERLSSNKDLTKLFKEYGLAANSNFQEMAVDYKRYKDPFLRQIDNTLNRYENDDTIKGQLKKGSAWIRESIDKLGVSKSTWGNEIQIAARNFFGGDETREALQTTKDIIGNNGITADTTVGEAKILWSENPENVNKFGDQTLLPVDAFVNNDMTIGELINNIEGKVKELDDDTMIDIEQMMEAYEDMSKYRTYDSGEAFGKKGSWADYFEGKQGLLPDMEFTLEGFLDRSAGFVDQAPHMVPSMIGKALVGTSAVVTAATGGASTPFTAITAKLGTGFILAGSMIQGAMEYGGTYMDGIRQGLQDELKAQGIEREPTAEEYLEALKNPDKYTSQGAAFMTGAAVTGVEFLSDYIAGKLTGTIGGAVAESGVGKAILGNTFSRYLASVGVSGLGGMQINAAQEYLTEGFQEYLGQVADNYIDKFVQDKEVNNIFTSNLKWDEISEAARMGYKQGELFGSVALVSTSVGLSQIQKSYIQQAEDIAYNIDMRPGSSTSKAGRAAFQRLQKAIEEDDSLSKSEKVRQIKELSRIREASMLTPSNVTGLEKIKLMKLLVEQKQLKNEIKSVDNKELSVNKIERKAEVDQQIIDIIKGADERSSTVGMSVLPTGQQQTTDTKSEQDSYSKIDEMYADEDFDPENRLDQKRILKEAGGTINNALNRLWRQGSLLTREQFKTALENEYLKTFLSYNPEQDTNNQGIGQQTSNLFNLRANKIAKENIRQQGDTISMSDEKAPQISDTTQQQDFDAQEQEVNVKRDKKYLGGNEKVNEAVGPEAKSQIKDETGQEILSQVGKGSTTSQTGSAINNMFGDSKARGGRGLWNIIGSKIGTFAKGYKNFVDNTVDADFIRALPAAYIKSSKRLSEILGVTKLGKTDKVNVKEDGTKSYSRPDVFSLGEITDETVQQVKDYLKESNPTRLGLLKKMSSEFAMESLQELKADQDFMQKLQTALGEDQSAVDFMNDLESKMDQRTAEDTSLDVDRDTLAKTIKDKITEENVDDITPEALTRAIKKLEDFRKSSLTAGGLNLVAEAALRIFKAAVYDSGFAAAIRNLIKTLKNALKNPKIFTLTAGENGNVAINKLVKNVKTEFVDSKGKKHIIQGPLDPKNKIHREFVKDFIIKEGYKYLPSSLLKSSFIVGYGSKSNQFFFTADERRDMFSQIKFARPKTKAEIELRKKIDIALLSKKDWFKKYNGKFDSETYQQLIKDNFDGVESILNSMSDMVKANPESILIVQALFRPSSASSNHFIRQFAVPVGNSQAFIDNNFKGEREHVWPANDVSALVFQAVQNDAVAELMPILKENYYQIGITKDQDGVIINDLKSNQTQEYIDSILAALNSKDTGLALSPLVRYFNSLVNGNEYQGQTGFNSNLLKVKGKTVASQYTMELNAKDQNADNIHYQNELTYLVLTNRMTQKDAVSRIKKALELNNAKAARAELNAENFPVLEKSQRAFSQKQTLLNSLKTRIKALKINKKPKGLSAFDMDDTLALTKEKVIYTLDGKKGELTAAEFATQYETLLEKGAEFDFSNFDNVDLSTEKGPLAGTALKRQGKYGSKDIYIVTARPNASQQAIKLWADSIGLNIPLENIITLEDGSPQAKADWLLSKAEQGYNDFYFADDSQLNVDLVKNILGQIDVKSRVQLAIADKANRLDQEMNDLIEDATDIGSDDIVSDVEASIEGKKRDKGFFKRVLRQFKITASADDFLGLGYYLFGKGEKGTRQQKWFIENLIEPYNKAEQLLISAKIAVANDFAELKKKFPSLTTKGVKSLISNPLNQEIGYKSYTKSQATRVYLWNKQGMDIPGMSKADIDGLVAAVEADQELNIFADELQLIQKSAEYPGPTANWLAGDIKSDILSGLDKTFRAELLTEWKENVDIIFSDKNMNKLEKAFGSKYVEALRDSLKRMETGTNRPTYTGSGARQVNEMMDWLNGSVGVAMFLNMRSGSLQMLSNVNFINWGDNNIYAAAKAFMSKDYVPTVIKLMNSDYLVNRRDGLKINVNEAELAAAANKGGFKGMLAYLLDKGFILTRIFDTLAIATGGATFYMNRVKSLQNRVNPETGKNYTLQEAEVKAFDDFYAIAEETQQSSNPSKISSQQASLFGRLILSYQNVTMQYNRKTKKSLLDLVNRRRKPGMTQRESDLSNLSSVVYYVAVQNLIFNSLQQALFALAFDEEDEKEKDKVANTINGMMDSLLFGLGFGGAIISTFKNVSLKLLDESEKKSPKYEEAAWNLFDISPVLDAKVRNIRTAFKTFSWNRKEMKKRGWSLENPAYLAVAQVISAATNLPIDRALRKYNNVSQAFDEETRTYERIALLMGWNGWNFGLPYWGRESTIKREAEEEEKLKEKFKNDVRKFKNMGFTKRVPFTGPNSGKPKGELGVDYVAIERYDGMIQYYIKPKK